MSALVTAGFHHMTLAAADAERAVAFYRDLLGLRLVARDADPDAPATERLLFDDPRGAPGSLLSVLVWPGVPRGGWGIGGVHHVALGTESDDTQLMWKRRLTDAGVHVSGPYERHYFRSIYFADPDGQILEIATRGPGYAVDEPADALGRTLMQPPEDEIRGHRDEHAAAALGWPEPVPAITPAMALEGVHHVSGITRDLDAAGEFLESALGLRLVKRTVNRDAPDSLHYFWASYDGREVLKHSAYTLFGWPRGGRTSRPGTGQTRDVTFRAANAAELPAWRDQLLAADVAAGEVEERGRWSRVRFKAPDGQTMALVADRPDSGA